MIGGFRKCHFPIAHVFRNPGSLEPINTLEQLQRAVVFRIFLTYHNATRHFVRVWPYRIRIENTYAFLDPHRTIRIVSAVSIRGQV
jgi:hypothetical protein